MQEGAGAEPAGLTGSDDGPGREGGEGASKSVMTSLMVPNSTVMLSDLVGKACHACLRDLSRIEARYAAGDGGSSHVAVPGAEERRRQKIYGHFHIARQRMLRLLVLLRGRSELDAVDKCMKVFIKAESTETRLTGTADDLFFLPANTLNMRTPPLDVTTAVDVLSSGTYSRLPRRITGMGLPPGDVIASAPGNMPVSDGDSIGDNDRREPSDDEGKDQQRRSAGRRGQGASAEVEDRAHRVLCRALAGEALPRGRAAFTRVAVDRGILTLERKGDFTVSLTVRSPLNRSVLITGLPLHSDGGSDGSTAGINAIGDDELAARVSEMLPEPLRRAVVTVRIKNSEPTHVAGARMASGADSQSMKGGVNATASAVAAAVVNVIFASQQAAVAGMHHLSVAGAQGPGQPSPLRVEWDAAPDSDDVPPAWHVVDLALDGGGGGGENGRSSGATGAGVASSADGVEKRGIDTCDDELTLRHRRNDVAGQIVGCLRHHLLHNAPAHPLIFVAHYLTRLVNSMRFDLAARAALLLGKARWNFIKVATAPVPASRGGGMAIVVSYWAESAFASAAADETEGVGGRSTAVKSARGTAARGYPVGAGSGVGGSGSGGGTGGGGATRSGHSAGVGKGGAGLVVGNGERGSGTGALDAFQQPRLLIELRHEGTMLNARYEPPLDHDLHHVAVGSDAGIVSSRTSGGGGGNSGQYVGSKVDSSPGERAVVGMSDRKSTFELREDLNVAGLVEHAMLSHARQRLVALKRALSISTHPNRAGSSEGAWTASGQAGSTFSVVAPLLLDAGDDTKIDEGGGSAGNSGVGFAASHPREFTSVEAPQVAGGPAVSVNRNARRELTEAGFAPRLVVRLARGQVEVVVQICRRRGTFNVSVHPPIVPGAANVATSEGVASIVAAAKLEARLAGLAAALEAAGARATSRHLAGVDFPDVSGGGRGENMSVGESPSTRKVRADTLRRASSAASVATSSRGGSGGNFVLAGGELASSKAPTFWEGAVGGGGDTLARRGWEIDVEGAMGSVYVDVGNGCVLRVTLCDDGSIAPALVQVCSSSDGRRSVVVGVEPLEVDMNVAMASAACTHAAGNPNGTSPSSVVENDDDECKPFAKRRRTVSDPMVPQDTPAGREGTAATTQKDGMGISWEGVTGGGDSDADDGRQHVDEGDEVPWLGHLLMRATNAAAQRALRETLRSAKALRCRALVGGVGFSVCIDPGDMPVFGRVAGDSTADALLCKAEVWLDERSVRARLKLRLGDENANLIPPWTRRSMPSGWSAVSARVSGGLERQRPSGQAKEDGDLQGARDGCLKGKNLPHSGGVVELWADTVDTAVSVSVRTVLGELVAMGRSWALCSAAAASEGKRAWGTGQARVECVGNRGVCIALPAVEGGGSTRRRVWVTGGSGLVFNSLDGQPSRDAAVNDDGRFRLRFEPLDRPSRWPGAWRNLEAILNTRATQAGIDSGGRGTAATATADGDQPTTPTATPTATPTPSPTFQALVSSLCKDYVAAEQLAEDVRGAILALPCPRGTWRLAHMARDVVCLERQVLVSNGSGDREGSAAAATHLRMTRGAPHATLLVELWRPLNDGSDNGGVDYVEDTVTRGRARLVLNTTAATAGVAPLWVQRDGDVAGLIDAVERFASAHDLILLAADALSRSQTSSKSGDTAALASGAGGMARWTTFVEPAMWICDSSDNAATATPRRVATFSLTDQSHSYSLVACIARQHQQQPPTVHHQRPTTLKPGDIIVEHVPPMPSGRVGGGGNYSAGTASESGLSETAAGDGTDSTALSSPSRAVTAVADLLATPYVKRYEAIARVRRAGLG